MMRLVNHGIAVFVFSLISSTVWASPQPGKPAPDFTGINSLGETVSLSQFRGQPVVLEWTNHQCPYVRKHYESGNMQRTQRSVTEAGAKWISIISSAPGTQGYVTAQEANRLSEQRGVYADMVVLDSDGVIGRAYAAKTTPQMFLIDEGGILRYMGAIDDRPSTRKSSLEGATNYLLTAWADFKGATEITPKSTKPYGCSVKYAR